MHPPLRPPHLQQAHQVLLLLRLVQALILTSLPHSGWEGRRTPEGRPYFVDNTLTQQRGLTYDAPLPSLVSKPWPHLQDGRSVLHPSAVCTSLATTLEQLPGTTHGCLQTSTITRCSTRATLQAKACLFSESAEDAGKCNIEIRRTRVLGDSYGAVVGRIGRI